MSLKGQSNLVGIKKKKNSFCKPQVIFARFCTIVVSKNVIITGSFSFLIPIATNGGITGCPLRPLIPICRSKTNKKNKTDPTAHIIIFPFKIFENIFQSFPPVLL